MHSKSVLMLATMFAVSFAAPLPSSVTPNVEFNDIDTVPFVQLSKRGVADAAEWDNPKNVETKSRVLSKGEFQKEFPDAPKEIYAEYTEFLNQYPFADTNDFIKYIEFHNEFPNASQDDYQNFMAFLESNENQKDLFESGPQGADQVFTNFVKAMTAEHDEDDDLSNRNQNQDGLRDTIKDLKPAAAVAV